MNINHEVPKQTSIRLGHNLHSNFDRISKETHIPKSVLARIAVEKLIIEIDQAGVDTALSNVCEV